MSAVGTDAMSKALDKLAERDFEGAIVYFTEALSDNARNYGGWIGRGSAYMFTNQLTKALVDFTSAIEVADTLQEKVDAYKKRGEVHCLLGGTWYTRPEKNEVKIIAALRNYNEALDILPPSSPLRRQVLLERAHVFNELGRFSNAMKDLDIVQRDVSQMMSTRALTILGRTLFGLGDLDRALAVFHRAMEMDRDAKDVEPIVLAALVHREMGGDGLQALFYLNMALHRLYTTCDEPVQGWKAAYVWYLRAETWQIKGLHHHALRDAVISIDINPGRVDAFKLAIQCARAVGAFEFAVKLTQKASARNPYDDIFKMLRIEVDQDCKYLNKNYSEFNLDVEMPHRLKEALAKKKDLHHITLKDLLQNCSDQVSKVTIVNSEWIDEGSDAHPLANYVYELWRNPMLIPDGPADFNLLYSRFVQVPLSTRLPLSFVTFDSLDREKVTTAAWHADAIGFLHQVNSKGFIYNIRKHRQAGLAVFQMAQALKKHINNLAVNQSGLHVPSRMCSRQKARSHAGISMQPLGYREFMDIAIRWRRAAEPSESVFWVDMLVADAFQGGLGREMKIIDRGCLSVKYGKFFPRCFETLKANVASTADSESSMRIILEARDLQTLRTFMKTDFWSATSVKKSSSPSPDGNDYLEGSKFTVVHDVEDDLTFSLRTFNNPIRWEGYERELITLWNSISEIMQVSDQTTKKVRVVDLALLFFYYWVNFGPLTRGSSIVGYTAMYAILMAFDLPLPEALPPELQLDWEALLSPDPSFFLRRFRPWLLDPRSALMAFPGAPNPANKDPTSLLTTCPDIEECCHTPAHVIYILSL